jgi:hypothetical protein
MRSCTFGIPKNELTQDDDADTLMLLTCNTSMILEPLCPIWLVQSLQPATSLHVVDIDTLPFQMPVSPWFYTNLPGYNKNWLWRGE